VAEVEQEVQLLSLTFFFLPFLFASFDFTAFTT
jgi:hypothetical protein